jgi:hypothetical protein
MGRYTFTALIVGVRLGVAVGVCVGLGVTDGVTVGLSVTVGVELAVDVGLDVGVKVNDNATGKIRSLLSPAFSDQTLGLVPETRSSPAGNQNLVDQVPGSSPRNSNPPLALVRA